MHRLSHDAAVTAAEARALFAPFAPIGKLVLAVSGGPDSTAMMGLFAEWRDRGGAPDAVVATVDHGLRADSADEAAAVGRAAQALGFAHAILRWTGQKPETGVQEAARNARHALLGAFARDQQAAGVMLAHTLDDQAETIVMRLARGSGLRGLGGMQAIARADTHALLRPFLGVPKRRMVATCEMRGWAFVRDPSNQSDRFLRPRLRRLLPLLAEEGLSAERLALFGARAASAERALQAAADKALAAGRLAAQARGAPEGSVEASAFSEAGAELATRMLRRLIGAAMSGAFAEPALERLEALALRLVTAIGAGTIFHATLGGAKISFRQGHVTVRPAPPRRPPRPGAKECSLR